MRSQDREDREAYVPRRIVPGHTWTRGGEEGQVRPSEAPGSFKEDRQPSEQRAESL